MELLTELEARRAIVVIRGARIEAPVRLAEALASGGDALVEITLTVENAFEALGAIAGDGRFAVGAGTVLDADDASEAIARGASFLVTPAGAGDVLGPARAADVPVVVGALTPTEVLAAWRGGAAAVKLFPAGLGGPTYLGELRAPMPRIPLIPSGGVNPADAGAYLDAGAVAVSCGSSVASPAAVAGSDWSSIAAGAAALAAAVDPYRAPVS